MCYYPITAYRSAKANHNGKYPLVFDKKQSTGMPLQVPCGHCLECRLKKAKMWSMRCVHEAKYHKASCFLTLTYDEDHVPYNNGIKTLEYKDVQLFMKRLRKELDKQGIKVRYFCSAEYGDGKRDEKGRLIGTKPKYRPHYHMILYGFSPDDIKFFDNSYSGLPIYRSKFLEEKWKCGMVFVGTVTEMSAGYVARYTLEKFAQKEEGFYDYREKEAIRMSRRNGIGYNWIVDNFENVAQVGFIVIDNIKHAIPRFYRNVIEKLNPFRAWLLKRRLVKLAKKKYKELLRLYGDSINLHYRRMAQEEYRRIAVKRLKRRLFEDKNILPSLC